MKSALLFGLLLTCAAIPVAFAQGDPPGELANRATVEAFYRAAFIERDAEVAASLMTPAFIQHHPAIPDGVAGMESYIDGMRAQQPEARREIKRVLTDGAYVIVQGHFTKDAEDPGAVTGDIFRLEDGRIAEQWGIVHPITPSPDPGNSNDVFGSNSAPYPTPTSTATSP